MKVEQSLIINTGKRPLMSKSQYALLKILFDCVTKQDELTLEHLVYIYAENVTRKIELSPYWGRNIEGVKCVVKYSVIECYLEDNIAWQRKIKGLVKSWFVSAIGLLVIKGYLKVLPNIDID